ncbi:heavy metal translocating P-type ATPase [Sporolactobacillus spathodeae]|uniref:Cd2+/Zn2+-exporting ATPase n=1 Tax=Sporolactobacillus spathodeae TaxID=1465502 RepID=A0ABS2Q8N8_9BACL|nr:heavy metal translocating P-type ATPase [Sporolactobacillus spathodeae]MBM7657680.1 Cd2+/Zn2+-exporting ATPase [Sporolactobacillus spathodeae]
MLKEMDLHLAANSSRLDQWRATIKKHGEMIAALLGGVLTLAGYVVSEITDTNVWYIYLVAYLIGGYYQISTGIKDTIKNRELNVELLMGLAAIGAACISHWLEGAVLIFIFALSGALETYSMAKSSRAISSLMDLQPETARLIINNQEQQIAVGQLQPGDVIHVKPGERIPADSRIILGETTIDESSMTGESVPVLKKIDDLIMAGTVNIDGNLHAEVTRKNEDSMFSKIIELVQTAQTEKAPSQLFIERFEKIYVKIVIALTVLMLFLPHYLFGWSWSDTIYRAMVMLVVASPCALVASTMPAVLSAVANGARKGILIKGGVHLEQLAGLKALAFDKTGTLTRGKPEVDWALNVSGFADREFYAAVAAIENNASHPLGEALVAYSQKVTKASPLESENVKVKPGFGVSGEVDGRLYTIGKAELFDEKTMQQFMNTYERELPRNHTLVYVAVDQKMAGAFALKDQIRDSSVAAIKTLHQYGIQTIMLTGDNEKTARAIQQETGVSAYIANCLPENKVQAIKQLAEKYGAVGMVGDGINDTPALAQSSVGIAMGGGNDAALATADIILMKNDLQRIADAVRLSKRMNRIIKMNMAFALSMIAFLMAVNLLQFISMPLGVIGHEGSTILVILNGLRMLRG